MPSILDEIVAYKRRFVAQRKRRTPLEVLQGRAEGMPATKDFAGALRGRDTLAIIAEIKRASPSKGVIRQDFDPEEIARAYEDNGAAAISVLTDEKYFQGSAADLMRVRKAVDVPVLCKDFVVDAYQIYEARAIGADAVLLIAAILDQEMIREYLQVAGGLDLDALVETHSRDELETVLRTNAQIIGINNRDLNTFNTDISTTIGLLPLIPKSRIVVSESGIHSRADVERLGKAGVNAVLVGEALMRKEDVGGTLRALSGLACC
jgi:indole-3-glycerol phosphate synthase